MGNILSPQSGIRRPGERWKALASVGLASPEPAPDEGPDHLDVVELVEGPSHTFEQLWAQELLAERVVERLSRRLGLGARKSAAG